MKLKLLFAFSLAAFFMLPGCKKNETKTDGGYKCTGCTATSEAIAANDASSKGIYKGIVIGSTGTIKFDISNSGSQIKAYLTIDGTSIELTSDVSWNGSQSYVAPFKGVLNGQQVTINFSVDMNGGEPMVTSTSIPGHPTAQFVILKETSSALIECFEGTYHTTKPEDGTFNILLSRTLKRWGGIARENGQSGTDDVEGTIEGDKIMQDGTTMGTLSGDEISGSFKDSDGRTVTIKGKRTR